MRMKLTRTRCFGPHRPETIAVAQRMVDLQQGKVLELALAGDRVPLRQSMEQ